MAALPGHIDGPKVVVRSIPGEPTLTISVQVGGKQRHLQRPKDELLEKPLTRLLASLTSTTGKGKKNKKRGPAEEKPLHPADVAVAVFRGGAAACVDASSMTNDDAWHSGHVLQLGDARLPILRNPPSVVSLEVYGDSFVGVPIVPLPQLLFATGCRWEWEVRRPSNPAWTPVAPRGGSEGPAGAGPTFLPGPEDVGCLFRARCHPLRVDGAGRHIAGEAAEVTMTSPVQPHPGSSWPLPELTPTTSPTLRVVSYNILADQYASTTRAKTVLFAHCPEQFLKPTYRRPLILGQLLAFQADILCLQEVDESAFRGLLLPGMAAAGYCGQYTNKVGAVREGEATFFRADRYALAATRDVNMRALFAAPPGGGSCPAGAGVSAFLSRWPSLADALQRVGTVAQLTLLRPRSARSAPLCVVNTHLFFHNDAPHIRSLHVWAAVQEARAFLEENRGLLEGCELAPTLLFCGDLNSDLNDGLPGALELLGSGSLDAQYWDWEWGKDFDWHGTGKDAGEMDGDEEEEEEEGEGEAEHGLAAASASGSRDQEERGGEMATYGMDLELAWTGPLRAAGDMQAPFSNYVSGYQGLLDYVWYDPSAVECMSALPSLTAGDLGGYLPSRHHPSDHLPIAFDLRFRDSSASEGQEHEGVCMAAAVHTPSPVHEAALHAVRGAAATLAAGHLVALPTDTLYGLAASARSARGVAALYEAKGRRLDKPVAIAVADVAAVLRFVHCQHLPPGLVEALLPGPVTLVLERRADAALTSGLNPGLAALGVRVPQSRFVRAVARQLGGALALTSANPSGGASTVAELWPACKAVYSAGVLGADRAGSTVVDLMMEGSFRILRRGADADRVCATLLAAGLQEDFA